MVQDQVDRHGTVFCADGIVKILRAVLFAVGVAGSAAHSQAVDTGTTFTIAPTYPGTIVFTVTSRSTDKIAVTGAVAGFHDRVAIDEEKYRQRFVRKEGRYRIIHTKGVLQQKVTEFGKTKTRTKRSRDVIRFDDLGIFDAGASDPVSLIPLYPGKPVRLGEAWSPNASVITALGKGTAEYHFKLISVQRDADGRNVGRVEFEFSGDLVPIKRLPQGTAKVHGEGWLLWNLDVHQRLETHIAAEYIFHSGPHSVTESISLEDQLVPQFRKERF